MSVVIIFMCFFDLSYKLFFTAKKTTATHEVIAFFVYEKVCFSVFRTNATDSYKHPIFDFVSFEVASVAELEPVFELAHVAKLAPVVKLASITKLAPIAKLASVAKLAPAVKAALVAKFTPVAKPTPVAKVTPVAELTPVAKLAPATELAPVAKLDRRNICKINFCAISVAFHMNVAVFLSF